MQLCSPFCLRQILPNDLDTEVDRYSRIGDWRMRVFNHFIAGGEFYRLPITFANSLYPD